MKTAAEAVHHAHQRGILHRDLKPSNILLDERGEPYVTDFGLAKRVEGDSEMTVSGAILGTPAYMAPEQASGRRGAVTTATDVYGLGAILYALLTGRAPFRGDSVRGDPGAGPRAAARTPVEDQPAHPARPGNHLPEMPGKGAARRYASAQALAEDLGRYIAGEPISARPVTRFERAVMWSRRNPAVASLLVLVMLVTVVGLGGVLWQWRAAIKARNTSEARTQDALDAKVKESEARRSRSEGSRPG